jgi:hypothetical protein
MVIIPDRPAQRAVYAKRFARAAYDRQQRGFGLRIKKATAKETA